MGNPMLGKMQIGVESPAAHGTPVAATKLLPITQGALPVDRKPTPIPYDLGVNTEVTGSFVQGILAQDTLSWDQGFFQLLPYLFSGLLKGGVIPAEKSVGKGDWEYNFTPSLTLDNTLDSFTLERGDSQQPVEIEYLMFKRLKISGQVNQEGGESTVKIEADYFGRQHTNAVFTAALAPMPTTIMNAKLATLFIDPTWLTVGTTEKAGILRAFDLEVLGGAYPKFNGANVETFTSHDQGPMSAMLALTLERGVDSEALRAAIGTFKVARLKIAGPLIGGGINPHSFTVDLGGYIEDVIAMAQTDRGGKLDTAVIHGQYDPTGAKLIVPKVVTTLPTL